MKIGLMGLGTVGLGLYKLIERMDLSFSIEKILVKNVYKLRPGVNTKLLTNKKEELDNIDILVEATGDYSLGYEMIKKHLSMGHHVVTANKEVIAIHMYELIKLSKENNSILLFEASVGGGIPIINNLVASSNINTFLEINGILNGTTNYILTKAFKDNMLIEDCIKEAIELGFAEPDPSADLKGLDVVRKIAILSKIAFNVDFDSNKIQCFGLEKIKDIDILFLKERKLILKFLAVAKYNDGLSINVSPYALTSDNTLSHIDYEYNSVLLKGNISGDLIFTGKGAGAFPTAYAIMDDLIKIKNNITYNFKNNQKPIELKNDNEVLRYYIRKDHLQYITAPITKEEFMKIEYDFYSIIK